MSDPTQLPARFLSLDSADVSHETVGGKAFNLAELRQADLPVPAGFIITTKDYSRFVQDNQIDDFIDGSLANLKDFDLNHLNRLSSEIHRLFLEGTLSGSFQSDLRQAHQWLAAEHVAVRSSATAEDLPQASFAGQQATLLNIISFESLLAAVVECWASLWTGRAISYRHQNDIDQRSLALAVIVQRMIPSQVSGVMFTADPLSGLRSQIHIDAAHGLGEAIVSGEVEPDHYVVSKGSGQLIKAELGSKEVQTLYSDQGGVSTVSNPDSGAAAISEKQIQQLVQLANEIEQLFDTPQDIEWAFAPTEPKSSELAEPPSQDRVFVLQSRPITSLFPLPAGVPQDPPHVFLFFGTVQGLVGPMTPSGQDAIRLIFAGGASLFGLQVDQHSQHAVRIAAERLWVDFTALIRHPIGARLLPRVIGAIEPGSQASLQRIMAEAKMQAGAGRLRLRTISRVFGFAVGFFWRALPLLVKPADKAQQIRNTYEANIRKFEALSPSNNNEDDVLVFTLNSFRRLQQAFVFAVPEIASGALAGLLPLLLLSRLSQRLTGSANSALEITRGLAHNVTTEMDLALWRTAQAIRSDQEAKDQFGGLASKELADRYLDGSLSPTTQQALTEFLGRYGMRGLAEIDLGQPRWAEQPEPVIQTLQSYLQIEQGPQAPDQVFARGEQSAQRAVDDLVSAAHQTPLGGLKAALIRGLAHRVRAFAGLRESPKFYIVQLMWIIRRRLLQAGQLLTSRGTFEQPDDIFFVMLDDLEALIAGEGRDWQSLIAERRANYQREQRRRQVPRLLLSDGRSFYAGMESAEPGAEALAGSPVSPGIAEGRVRIVMDPHEANLSPGEILVCQGTDPSWTPLFLAAAGLVMETGGMMTHGAIVAREYGIPAVVGVDKATQRLQTGDRIRLDGGSGAIEIMERN